MADSQLCSQENHIYRMPKDCLLYTSQRDGQWFIGPDAFFFEEGTGDQYESARYGEFRLQEDGSTLLVGLRDEAFTPLGHIRPALSLIHIYLF